MEPFPLLFIRIFTVLTNFDIFLFHIILNLCLLSKLCASSGVIEDNGQIIELIVETSSVHGCDFIILLWVLHVNGHSSNLVAHSLHLDVELELVLT